MSAARTNRPALALLALPLAGMALAACSASSGGAGSTPAGPATSSPVAAATTGGPTADGTGATSGTGGTGANQAAECTASQLQITEGQRNAATGHQGATLSFKNVSSTACFIQGYPGVAAINSSGKTVANATRTLTGFLGGASSVTRVSLSPGQTTNAIVEALDAATNGSTSCMGSAVKALLVIAPDQRTSTKLPDNITICADFQVHPVGSNG